MKKRTHGLGVAVVWVGRTKGCCGRPLLPHLLLGLRMGFTTCREPAAPFLLPASTRRWRGNNGPLQPRSASSREHAQPVNPRQAGRLLTSLKASMLDSARGTRQHQRRNQSLCWCCAQASRHGERGGGSEDSCFRPCPPVRATPISGVAACLPSALGVISRASGHPSRPALPLPLDGSAATDTAG